MGELKQNSISLGNTILGIGLIVLGIFTTYYQSDLLMRIYDVIGFILLFQAGRMLISYFEHKDKSNLLEVLLFIVAGCIFFFYTDMPVGLTKLVLAGYMVIFGIIKLIGYYTYKQNKVGGRFIVLSIGLIAVIAGILSIVGNFISIDTMLVVIGIYTIVLGINYCIDAVDMILPRNKSDKFKRKIRIDIPIAVAALMPRQMLEYINNHVQTMDQKEFNDYKNETIMEVFVHVSPDGMGVMGHCDLYFDGEVLSYGNYDFKSTKLFEILGDGVLFTCKDKQAYIDFAIKESNKTIFGYYLNLSPEQIESVRAKIKEIKENTYQWYPIGYTDKDFNEDYASRLYHNTQANFYKFKSGKFKTYFVLGTNCVLLADSIIGASGSDIVDINGIVAPGTYYDYLEKESIRENGLVSKKTIYHKMT
ncbi:MAG: DUF308 domain-containing protein [Thomasclavelia sp.]|nr:DUF308 domain-containing protein [Thomasclavelia sp.]